MKKLVIALAMVIALSIPASTVAACGRNQHHARHHHHHFFMRHHQEPVVTPVQVNDGSYAYYHDVLGYTKAQYLIQIKKMP